VCRCAERFLFVDVLCTNMCGVQAQNAKFMVTTACTSWHRSGCIGLLTPSAEGQLRLAGPAAAGRPLLVPRPTHAVRLFADLACVRFELNALSLVGVPVLMRLPCVLCCVVLDGPLLQLAGLCWCHDPHMR
jgi:hypothetical protein